MKITSYAVARPQYYDRNASTVVLTYYSFNTAPHSSTTRWTTTVAAGKRVLVEQGVSVSRRTTAATVLGDVLNQQKIVGTPLDIFIIPGYLYNNTLNVTERQTLPTQFTVYAGETFYCTTADTGTGGGVEYVNSAKCTQFDA